MIFQATIIRSRELPSMDNVLKEPGVLKLSSSKLTINHPKSARLPESNLISFNIQEEHLPAALLGCYLLPFSCPELLCISRASSPNNHIPSRLNLYLRSTVFPKFSSHRVYSASPFINRNSSLFFRWANGGWETDSDLPKNTERTSNPWP